MQPASSERISKPSETQNNFAKVMKAFSIGFMAAYAATDLVGDLWTAGINITDKIAELQFKYLWRQLRREEMEEDMYGGSWDPHIVIQISDPYRQSVWDRYSPEAIATSRSQSLAEVVHYDPYSDSSQDYIGTSPKKNK